MGTVNARDVSQHVWGRRCSDVTGSRRARFTLVRRYAALEPVRRFPAIDARLVRQGSTRRYVIRRGRAETEWFCEVWLGDTRLRGTAAECITDVVRYVEEYRREIERLLERGWRFQ
jgi:hypothetical protein